MGGGTCVVTESLLNMSAAIQEPTEGVLGFLENQFQAELNSSEKVFPNAFENNRSQAWETFKSLGIPTSKHEEWKYTSLKHLSNIKSNGANATWEEGSFNKESYLSKEIIEKVHVDGLNANTLVFVNGIFTPYSSNVKTPVHEAEILSLRRAASKRLEAFESKFGGLCQWKNQAMAALNTAMPGDGVFIHVPEGKEVELPVVLHFIADTVEHSPAFQPRNLIVLGKGAKLSVVESWTSVGSNSALVNVVTEVYLEEGARLDYYKLQAEGSEITHIENTEIHQADGSVAHTYTLSLSGKVVRNDLNFRVDGTDAEANMWGLYLPGGKTLIDNHTLVDHLKPNSNSNELFKGILGGKSTGVFNGKIYVKQAAQKTNAFQSNRNILLSDQAEVNTKPQLEIFADDVKCSHGAAIGALDEEPIFYLRSRGIGEDLARNMLLRAFAGEVLEKIELPELKTLWERRVDEQLDTILAESI